MSGTRAEGERRTGPGRPIHTEGSPPVIDGDVTLTSPRLGHMLVVGTRTDTNDAALACGIIRDDEYRLRSLPPLSGTAIDIGAHIGSVSLALALDHPDLAVVAVEVVPENCEVLRHNIALNGLQARISVVEAAAGRPGQKTATVLWDYRSAGSEPEAYVRDSRYIAGIYGAKGSDADAHRVPVVSLDDLMADLPSVALLKIDCEGCEWGVLRSRRVADVERIVGEFHNGRGFEALQELLGATHTVSQVGGKADIGLFEAVAK